ncbi:hypothetical protein DK846_07945 [Methanospirillum lacunae]|uniref:Uncharacterized protein n=1 Tax=Methanospirillum lacunae TaxID=668570 RepID=A0A2V2N2U5_9EURY|nr:hypothetical protein DK846_07945 [Methanospirillum lacunae]
MINPPTYTLTMSSITPSNAMRRSVVQITNLTRPFFLFRAKINLTQKEYSKFRHKMWRYHHLHLSTGSLNLAGVSSGVWNVSGANFNG